MTRESWTRLGGVALVGAGLAVALVVTGREARATDEPRATPPSGVTARRVEVERRRAPQVFMGVVRPTDRAMVAFVEGGRLVGRAVDVGDRVEAGQVLAQLDPRPYANAVRAATAQGREVAASRAQVARDHARAERLAQGGSRRSPGSSSRRAAWIGSRRWRPPPSRSATSRGGGNARRHSERRSPGS